MPATTLQVWKDKDQIDFSYGVNSYSLKWSASNLISFIKDREKKLPSIISMEIKFTNNLWKWMMYLNSVELCNTQGKNQKIFKY